MAHLPSLTLALVRHSITPGNLAGQYVGRLDQPLAPEGEALALRRRAAMPPDIQRVFCSPLLRCRQTAALLFPEHRDALTVVESLREMDFGAFEGKTHADLQHDPAYRLWVGQNGAGQPPPGGETLADFTCRCLEGLGAVRDACRESGVARAAVVLHGGSIMALMGTLGQPARPFYDWKTHNCCGFLVKAPSDGAALRLLAPLEDAAASAT